MIRFLLGLVFILLTIQFIYAQGGLNNANFEFWTEYDGYQDPNAWTSPNDQLVNEYNQEPVVFKSEEFHEGTFSVEMTTIRENILNTYTIPGGLCNCDVEFDVTIFPTPSFDLQFVGGKRNMGLPKSLNGYYKYHVPSDTLSDRWEVHSVLTKWNTKTNKRDTIAQLDKTYSEETDEFTAFEVPYQYFSTEIPDSIVVYFMGGAVGSSPEGTTLIIDAMTLPTDYKVVAATDVSKTCGFDPVELNVLDNDHWNTEEGYTLKVINEPLRGTYTLSDEGLLTYERENGQYRFDELTYELCSDDSCQIGTVELYNWDCEKPKNESLTSEFFCVEEPKATSYFSSYEMNYEAHVVDSPTLFVISSFFEKDQHYITDGDEADNGKLDSFSFSINNGRDTALVWVHGDLRDHCGSSTKEQLPEVELVQATIQDGVLTITPRTFVDGRLSITHMSGQILLDARFTETAEIPLSHLASGVVIYQVVTAEGKQTGKIIVP